MGQGMKVSLILPYWDRQEAADKAFQLLDKQYAYLHMEVIVVDDGNKVPFVVPKTRLDVRVVRLPQKKEPTPQSKAWNAGVEAAEGEIIVLSCVEVLHETNVIEPMIAELFRMGKMGYVMASAWCPEEGKWHCHSTEQIPTCPKGTGPAFCAMMFKDTFNLAGGFDEEYHAGAGYEDKDWIQRLVKIGADFKIRDDLKVIHPKSGATIRWKPEGFARNRELYLKKWPHLAQRVTFVCLKAGDAYGPEYVNILFDMVNRNLTAGTPGQFVCITDNPEGLNEGIGIIPLPDDLETWWGKLYMFKRGLFPDGERCIFLDLDTVIVSSLDEIIKYRGQFATLKDFYYPNRVGPAIIMWEAGDFASYIWEAWVSEGKPRHPMGDLWWINNLDQGRFPKDIDKLQDVFPKKFVSYKADCRPYPPEGAAVVCFHGQPKPENCGAEWVAQTWRVGGGSFAELEAIANTAKEMVAEHVRSSSALAIPWLEMQLTHDEQVVIVGGGPSVEQTLPEILWRKSIGQSVYAVNGSAKWLNDHGIIPDAQIIIDAQPHNLRFIKEAKAKRRFLASQCHPSLFDTKNVTLFHMNTEGILDAIPENDKPLNLISSGTTVSLAAMAIAYTQGFRSMHLHGFDSSFEEKHHAYQQTENDKDAVLDVSVYDRAFKAAPWMVKQAQEFQVLASQLADAGCVVTVAGDGLLPFIAHCMSSTGEINGIPSASPPAVC